MEYKVRNLAYFDQFKVKKGLLPWQNRYKVKPQVPDSRQIHEEILSL